jgi:hypothetical protein
MKRAVLLLTIMLAACDGSGSKMLTYDQLLHYPTSCKQADSQLAELKAIQVAKHFNEDPDKLSPDDYIYNGRLKATIWWYSYECNKS